jgi:hypothetical protein
MFALKCRGIVLFSLSVLAMLMNVPSSAAQTPKLVSICDVLSDPGQYHGQWVSMRVTLTSSSSDSTFDELAPLETDRCYSPRRQNSLRIGISDQSPSNPPKGWKVDEASFDNAEETIAKLLKANPELRVLTLTIQGIILDGGPRPNGVTRDPWYPASIMASAMNEIRIAR